MIFMFFMMFTFTMRIFLFLIFCFPRFDDDFFFFGSEIYRLPNSKCVIQFFDIVSGNVFFSTSSEMAFHHIRECIHQDIEWLTFIFCDMMSFAFGSILEKCDDCVWIFCTEKCELIPTIELHNDIRHSEKRCPPRPSPYFDSFDLVIRNIEEIG